MSLLGGKGGLAAWQWIFVLFGAFTVFLAILCFFLIVDFPDKNTFLTEKETAFVLQRIESDRGDSVADKLTKEKLILHLSDWKGWACTLLYACTTTPAYAFAYFLPGTSSFPHYLEIRLTSDCSLVVLSGGGYNVQMSLLLSAPPYLSAAIYTFAVGPKFPPFVPKAVLDVVQISSPTLQIATGSEECSSQSTAPSVFSDY